MDKKQTEFETALEITKKQLMSSQERKTDLGAVSDTAMPVTSAPANGTPGSAPKAKGPGQSDISGTEKIKKK
jgi:hypothetical protein